MSTLDAGSWTAVGLRWVVLLLLVGAIELAVGAAPAPPSAWEAGVRFYPPTRVPTVEESTLQWQLARLAEEPADIVLLGDSSAMMGLVPQAFSDRTGLRAQNYATICWMTVDGHADVLELYLARHGAPQVVVYQMGTLVHVVPHDEIVASGFYDRFRSYVGLGAHPLLPSLAWREPARALVEGDSVPEAYLSVPRGREASDDLTREFLTANGGWNVDRAGRSRWDDVRPIPATLQPEAMAGLDRLFALSDTWGFRLFVVHAPLPAFLQTDTLTAQYAAVEAEIRRHADAHEQVSVVGPFARYFRTEAFANVEHLTPDGAWAHSVALSDLVARTLGIPDPRRPAPDDDLRTAPAPSDAEGGQ